MWNRLSVAPNRPRRTLGLSGHAERATRMGGLLEFSSSGRTGTEVQLSIPSGVAIGSLTGPVVSMTVYLEPRNFDQYADNAERMRSIFDSERDWSLVLNQFAGVATNRAHNTEKEFDHGD